MSKVTAIVLAAGSGSRMQSSTKKQFMEINGKPVLWYSLKQFEKSSVDEVILVTSKEDIAYCKTEIVEKYQLQKVTQIVSGGKERYHSVHNGLLEASGDIVLIHDGARPMVTQEMIEESIQCAKEHGACVVGVPVKDTIKIVEDKKIVETPDRNTLWITQTPQAFDAVLLKNAYEKMMVADDKNITDDAMVVEKYTDCSVRFVTGQYTNIKITTPDDILLIKNLLEKEENKDE